MPRGVYDHSGRVKHRTPAEKKAAHAAAVEKYQKSPKGRRAQSRAADNQNEKRWRHRERAGKHRSTSAWRKAGFHIAPNRTALERPPLYTIATDGKITREDHRSAEQVIEQWEKKEKAQ